MYEPPFSAIRRPMPRSTLPTGVAEHLPQRVLGDLLLLLQLDERRALLQPQPDEQRDQRSGRSRPGTGSARPSPAAPPRGPAEAGEDTGGQQGAGLDADERQRGEEPAARRGSTRPSARWRRPARRPAPKPWHSRRNTSRIGAQTPIVVVVGSRPTRVRGPAHQQDRDRPAPTCGRACRRWCRRTARRAGGRGSRRRRWRSWRSGRWPGSRSGKNSFAKISADARPYSAKS